MFVFSHLRKYQSFLIVPNAPLCSRLKVDKHDARAGLAWPSLPVVILPLLVNISRLVGIEMSNINLLSVENLVKLMLELFVLGLKILTKTCSSVSLNFYILEITVCCRESPPDADIFLLIVVRCQH